LSQEWLAPQARHWPREEAETHLRIPRLRKVPQCRRRVFRRLVSEGPLLRDPDNVFRTGVEMSTFLNRMWTAVAVLSFVVGASAQDQSVSINGPILGYIQDSAGTSVQPILGVLGASLIGRPLELGSEIHNAAISPKQNFALGIRGEN